LCRALSRDLPLLLKQMFRCNLLTCKYFFPYVRKLSVS
jgi:hypothetical protein